MGLLALTLASVGSLVVRYRRSVDQRRAQLRWLLLAGVGLVAYLLACGGEVLITGSTGIVATVVGVLALLSLPLAVTAGMLRHDLYEVDRVLAATITYTIAGLVLFGLFVATTVTAGLALGRDSGATAALATAICAAALAPVRARVQRLVDSRFHPPRRAVAQAIEQLQRRIHAGQAQPEELQDALRAALRDPTLRVGIRLPGTRALVDAAGSSVDRGVMVPVTIGGEEIGVLVTSAEPASTVLRAVAPMTASLVENIRLRAELGVALRDVHESRARLIHVGNAERQRLERDLHDGAQQRLVALGMAMRVAQRQLASDTVDIDDVLERAVIELTTAVTELRQIAHGLRPTSLDDGLEAALTALVRSLPIPVVVDVPVHSMPEDLTTTAYYVACEAVTNAAKYAGAGRVAVRVDHSGDEVRITVEDNGRGGAVVRPGSGLAGLVDRVAALGGSMSVRSPIGAGTVIEAVLPCAS